MQPVSLVAPQGAASALVALAVFFSAALPQATAQEAGPVGGVWQRAEGDFYAGTLLRFVPTDAGFTAIYVQPSPKEASGQGVAAGDIAFEGRFNGSTVSGTVYQRFGSLREKCPDNWQVTSEIQGTLSANGNWIKLTQPLKTIDIDTCEVTDNVGVIFETLLKRTTIGGQTVRIAIGQSGEGACASTNPSGNWETDEGRMRFPVGPMAGRLRATYESDEGRIVEGTLLGRTLNGYWVEAASDVRCDAPKDGSHHWGHIQFEFNSDFTRFRGRWGYCDAATSREWNGTRDCGTATETVGNCDEKDSSGTYFVAKCTDKCTRKFWRWNFFVTNYNVSSTFGLGEHQGIWLVGNEYKIDPRFPSSQSVAEQIWKTSTYPYKQKVEHPGQTDWDWSVGRLVASSDPVSRWAQCAEVTPVLKKTIYNHGRTIARDLPDDLDYRFLLEGPPIKSMITKSVGPLDHAQWSDDTNADVNYASSLTACLEKIEDGYCDAVCGNCSYVMPDHPASLLVSWKGNYLGQKFQYKRTEGYREGKRDVFYSAKQPGPPFVANPAKDSFTHCVDRGSAFEQQAVASLPHVDDFVSGLWGHNSNTDAEAEFQQFKACVEDPMVAANYSCAVDPATKLGCGRIRLGPDSRSQQWPCLDRTNEAKDKWARAGGLHNIDDSKLGSHRHPQPFCEGDTSKPVNGM